LGRLAGNTLQISATKFGRDRPISGLLTVYEFRTVYLRKPIYGTDSFVNIRNAYIHIFGNIESTYIYVIV
jgi:hypothetical protein